MNILRVAILAAAVASIGSCGSNPNSPSHFAQVAGNWTGNLSFSQSGGSSLVAVVMTLSESGSAVSGTWAASLVNWNGQITGTVDKTSFTGTFTLSAPSVGGGVCTGSASVAGPAGGATISWTGAGFTGSCNNEPVGLTWSLQRQ